MASEECHEEIYLASVYLLNVIGRENRRRAAGGFYVRRRRTLLRLLRFEIHVDGDVVAEEEAAVVEGFVPVDAVVLAVHGRRQREAGALVAPRVLAETVELHRDGDVLRHAAHR